MHVILTGRARGWSIAVIIWLRIITMVVFRSPMVPSMVVIAVVLRALPLTASKSTDQPLLQETFTFSIMEL